MKSPSDVFQISDRRGLTIIELIFAVMVLGISLASMAALFIQTSQKETQVVKFTGRKQDILNLGDFIDRHIRREKPAASFFVGRSDEYPLGPFVLPLADKCSDLSAGAGCKDSQALIMASRDIHQTALVKTVCMIGTNNLLLDVEGADYGVIKKNGSVLEVTNANENGFPSGQIDLNVNSLLLIQGAQNSIALQVQTPPQVYNVSYDEATETLSPAELNSVKSCYEGLKRYKSRSLVSVAVRPVVLSGVTSGNLGVNPSEYFDQFPGVASNFKILSLGMDSRNLKTASLLECRFSNGNLFCDPQKEILKMNSVVHMKLYLDFYSNKSKTSIKTFGLNGCVSELPISSCETLLLENNYCVSPSCHFDENGLWDTGKFHLSHIDFAKAIKVVFEFEDTIGGKTQKVWDSLDLQM
ncbi:type II secretion system protein [Bdellovibrio sp.]|uniref:type II secretion system protein n=1 Tax=Bdellovibrio sp. TaxID=28201 RepID=UPI0039E551C8